MVSASVRYLFYQQMDEKIKTLTLRFPARENPDMEMALFDWPIVLQYDIKAKYRLISRKFSGMKFFHPSVRLTNQKPRVYPFDQPMKWVYSRSFVVSVLFARFHFKVIRKSLYRCIPLQPPSVLFTLIHGILQFIPFTAFFDGNSIGFDSIHCLFHSNLFHSIYCLFSVKFHSIPLHCSLSIKSIPISFIVELISFHYSISVSITVIVPLYLLNFLPLSNVFRCPACVF